MATYVECMRFDGGGFVALRSDQIQAVFPIFETGSDEFTSSRIYMTYGGSYVVNETWEQIAEAMEAPGFTAATKPFGG